MSGVRPLRAIALATSFAGGFAAHVQAQSQAPADDPFAQGAVYVEADEILDDREKGQYIARGSVEARYGDRVIRAEEVIYLPDEGRVRASGGVTIIAPDGLTTFAEEAEFSDDLTQGVIVGLAARFGPDARGGAAYAVRRPDASNELNNAYYTACAPCAEDGTPKKPTWRLKARKVVQDPNSQSIFYRDAVFEVKGVPVLYTPFFAHADPTAGRRSGFLFPTFGESTRTGTFFEQPFFWSLSDHHDITLSPRIMSNANPLMLFDYRRRFHSGLMKLEGSFTSEQDFQDDETKVGDERFRGHLYGDGLFRISDEWAWGFGLERVTNNNQIVDLNTGETITEPTPGANPLAFSDDLYLRRYGIDDQDAGRGIYSRGDKRLLTQVFGIREGDNSYVSVAALGYQGLQDQDDDDEFPIVAPLLDARRSFKETVTGGRVEARASSAMLHRVDGVDSRRITAQAEWRRRTVFSNGIVATPFALARADIYHINDHSYDQEIAPDDPATPAIDPTTETINVDDEVVSRGLGYVGGEVSWPFGRKAGPIDLVVEPVASVVAAPKGGNLEEIPNQDSVTFDLDEASLFAANRAPGYDLWEDGLRATVGGRATARWDKGGEASFFLGQGFRQETSSLFPQNTGLNGTRSDIVGAASIEVNQNHQVSALFRLDEDDLSVQRLEATARTRLNRASLDARYVQFDAELATNRPSKELSLQSGLRITENIGAYYQATRDLDEDENRRSFLGLVYDDECTRVELVYKQERTQDRSLEANNSVRLQVSLSTIGAFGKNR